MERAYATFAVKALDAEERIFGGLATSPVPDRVMDIIEPLGCRYKNPTVLLRAHDHQSPIGEVHFDRPTKTGIGFKARIPQVPEPGLLRDRVDLAWAEIKHGLIRAVSIGFRPLETEPLKGGGTRFLKCEIFELSTVAVPAQALATIDSVKALDQAVLRGEAPRVERGSLWQSLRQLGLDSLNEFEASSQFKRLGSYGPSAATARSSQRMIEALAHHIEDLDRRLSR